MKKSTFKKGTAKNNFLEKSEILVLLSGGIDSTACVNFFLEIGRTVSAMFVDYQQLAVLKEKAAAEAVSNYYGINLTKLRWIGSVPKTDGLIPGRNAFLLMAALMERLATVTTIAIGIHAGTQYNDCSKEFLRNMQAIFNFSSEGQVTISAPFLEWNKSEVYSYCFSRKIPMDLTYSCEVGTENPCGSCLSCLDRKTLDVSA